MDFIEEDMLPGKETYEAQDDLSLIRIPHLNGSNNIRPTNHRSTHNKENVCNNVIETAQMQAILANIGPEDDVQLFSHFFEVVEKKKTIISLRNVWAVTNHIRLSPMRHRIW